MGLTLLVPLDIVATKGVHNICCGVIISAECAGIDISFKSICLLRKDRICIDVYRQQVNVWLVIRYSAC
jgi:hypothetical protein